MVDIPTNIVIRPLLIESRSTLAYCYLIRETKFKDNLTWYHEIYHFLKFGTYLEATIAKDRKTLK